MTEVARASRAQARESLLRLIRQRQDVTRGDLCDLSGFSRSTVVNTVGALIHDGLVVEVQGPGPGPGSGSGRPAKLLRVAADGSVVAGVDFGHNHLQVAIADATGRVLARSRRSFDVDRRAQEALDLAAGMVRELVSSAGVAAPRLAVAGIPGPVETAGGRLRSPSILSGWVGISPGAELSRRLRCRVHVENDAFLGAYGELACGAGRGVRDFLYVKVSHGVGAAMVIGGEPYRGASGVAGEIGHTQLRSHTELCRCGNRGCLEAVVSVSSVRAQIAHTHPTEDPETLRFDADDVLTWRVIDGAGRILGEVLANICNLLNPGAIVIGGELGGGTPRLLDAVRETLLRDAQPACAAAVRVVAAELGEESELTGALQLATMMLPTPAR
ncbi:ROK family protein [Nocardioides flavescens]|uniref:ROK family protein n=1 Tax=Nocardioides flavescens TaxID=2691959 RepID=A0A6L7ESZ2_9ACTN|nr:ROK family protein [Nocardioides flavescens]MXG90587.1 ROK family protein [Nocardioides flavescens]